MFFQSVVKSVTNNLLSFLLSVVLQCILWSPNSHNGTFEWQVRHAVKIPFVFLCMFASLTIGLISKFLFVDIIYMFKLHSSSFSCWMLHPLILQFKGASLLIPEPPAFALNNLNAPSYDFNLNKIALLFKTSKTTFVSQTSKQTFWAQVGVKSPIWGDNLNYFKIQHCQCCLFIVPYHHTKFQKNC